MECNFIDLDKMSDKKGYIIESEKILDTIRALAIIDFHMYLVTASAGDRTFYYCGSMHRVHNSLHYHGHYIIQFQNNTQTWYCPYLHSKGYPPRYKSLDTLIATINRSEK